MTPLLAALQKLEAHPEGVSASQLTKSQRQALERYGKRTQAVKRLRRGRGSVYAVVQPQVITQKLAELAPRTSHDDNLPQRAQNIDQTRTSKGTKAGHAITYLLLKARGEVHWRAGGQQLDLTKVTEQQGVTALAINSQSPDDWRTTQPLWLIENQALFDHLDWLPTSPASVLWYRGQLPDALIDWLAVQPRSPDLVHFPDYDGVGLNNYARLKEALGNRVRFWLMPRWQQKIQQHGNAQIYQDTRKYLARAHQRLSPYFADEPDLHALFTQLQHQAKTLEQEAVWLL